MFTNTWAYTSFGDSSIDFRVYDECFKPKPRLKELFISQNAIDEESWLTSFSAPVTRRRNSSSGIVRSASLDFSVIIYFVSSFLNKLLDHCGRRIRRWRQKKSKKKARSSFAGIKGMFSQVHNQVISSIRS